MTCRFRPRSDLISKRRRILCAAALGFACLLPMGAAAQIGQDPAPKSKTTVLTIEPDRLFASTAFGQRLTADLEAQGAALREENRRIEAELAEEETRLTAQRATLTPEEFRALADAFDAKVQATRSRQDAKARSFSQANARAQQLFLQAIAPVLEKMMLERDAAVLLDRRSVFVSLDRSDMTDAAIERIDAQLGAGTEFEPDVPEE